VPEVAPLEEVDELPLYGEPPPFVELASAPESPADPFVQAMTLARMGETAIRSQDVREMRFIMGASVR
jgi:hypothetical protein